MRPQDLIRKKRDREELTPSEIAFFVQGVTNNHFADYQASALLMAIFLNGMSEAEQQALTEEFLRSGEALNLSDIPKRKVDKHSTGGVGDKTSLIVAPLAAATGLCVPMISGRGLSHTGGTLDKLEAIPGFRVHLSLAEFRSILERTGCAIMGQTAEIAPADKKLYALRDVTATVESIPLIAASIMSKKLAEGLDGLVLDIKTGDGAFMKRMRDARRLAQTLVQIGERAGVRTVALITDMDQPLGLAVGNALEVIECCETLRGRGPQDLTRLSVELTAQMLLADGASDQMSEARKHVRDLLQSGAGLQKFRELIEAQGGDSRVVDDYTLMPQAAHREALTSERGGYIASVAAEIIGTASMLLGAGRVRVEDRIDPAVGLVLNKKIGDQVHEGEPLLFIHYNSDERLGEVNGMLRDAFHITSHKPKVARLVKAKVS
ncbi:MAG: thymidine phosphorylase [Pyrinomonadaceae bacterium]|nr:thymidine phosphorylase [Pyrinomonadaceae bacterium]